MIHYHIPTTIEHLEALVADKTQENSHLEFKSSRALRDASALNKLRAELPRDASAFANAGGGAIVFGIDEDDECRAKAIAAVADGAIPEGWFEDVLINTVSPKLPGVRVARIEHRTGTVFVLHIPLSLLAPHQAADRKYYARRQFRRDDLEHYEIELLRHRSKGVDKKVFGGITIANHWLLAVVENNSFFPIYDVKFRFEERLPPEFTKGNIFDAGVSVVPARSKIEYRLATIYDALQDPIMSKDLSYQFAYRLESGSDEEYIPGRIHLSDLIGASIAESDIAELLRVLKDGFKDLTKAFKGR